MRAWLNRLLQRAQARAATLSERSGAPAPDGATGLARARQRVARHPDDGEAALDLGVLLVDRGAHEEAEPHLRRALALAPGHARAGAAHRALGISLGARGDRHGAIAAFRRAIDTGGGDEGVYADLCVLLATVGDLAGAAEIARRGIATYPASAVLHAYLGNVLGLSGDAAGAARSYATSLEIGPPTADTHYNLGVVLGKLDRVDESIASYRDALALDAAHADARLNLANALQRTGRPQEALAHFTRASAHSTASVEALLGEGTTRQATGEPARALAVLERALALAPGDARIPVAMGSALVDLGRVDEAVQRFEEGLRLRPGDVNALVHLGNLHLKLGDKARAIARYREALEHEPEHGVAHLVRALSGDDAERASDKYVANLFDGYADKFDSHLVEELRYETPRLLAEMLARHVDAARRTAEVLDLGCGTGLVGAAIAPWARRIVGVDLSPRMLEKARATGHYDRLEAAELLAMMSGEADASYDVVTAADVFVYLGRLDEAVREARRLLRPAGLVAFSVESLDAIPDAAGSEAHARGYRLNASARYAHTLAYLRQLAQAHAFDWLELREVTLRFEKGVPVAGYVLLWRAGDAPG